MRIQIKVVLEANDELDVEAMKPDYVSVVNDYDSAIAEIGKIQRAVSKVENQQSTDDMDDNSDEVADPLVIEKDF